MYVGIDYQNLTSSRVQILPTVGDFPTSGTLKVNLYVNGVWVAKREYPVTDEPWVQFCFGVSGLSPEKTYIFTVRAILNMATAEDSETLTTPSAPPPIEYGLLSVDTAPVKGQIFVNDRYWGVAPQSRSLTVGTHIVRFAGVAGYFTPASMEVYVKARDETKVWGLYYETVSGKGTLTIDTAPVKGEVYVNGQYWGVAPQSREVDPGTYTVSFSKVEGYETPPSQDVTTIIEGMVMTGIYSAAVAGLTYIVYDTDQSDLAVAQMISKAKGFPLLQTPEDKDPSMADPVYDDNNLILVGLWPANAYVGYYFPEIWVAIDWTKRVIDRTKVKGVSGNGKYVINTIQRTNGTTVTVVGGVDAADTIRAAAAFISPLIHVWDRLSNLQKIGVILTPITVVGVVMIKRR